MFSPQRVEPVNREQLVFRAQSGRPLPWDAQHELAEWQLTDKQAWRHVVYVGIYRLDEVFKILSCVFEPDQDSFDERPAGESAVAAFLVDEDGRVMLGSEVLSSCAWATGRCLDGSPNDADWLADFNDATMDFGSAWRDLVTDEVSAADEDVPPTFVPRVLDAEALAECLDLAVAYAGTGDDLPCPEIRIQSQIVARRNADSPAGHEFLNSMIMEDLGRVSEQAAKGELGAALREYLSPEHEVDAGARVDVRHDLNSVLIGTAPGAVPAGRWPTMTEHPLALNQQLAVDTVVGPDAPPVLGVNGPPGTGKTTMLRDLVAALVVERATRLAALRSPHDAFAGPALGWRTGQYKRSIKPLRPELTGFEMVVASTNNGAVENVTDEIPAAAAVDGSWREIAGEVDYYQLIASALLTPDDTPRPVPGNPTPNRAWALVAARLGNKRNRSRFVNKFWYHRPDDPDAEDAWHGLRTILQGYENAPPAEPWSVAVAGFRAAEARVEQLRTDRQAVHDALASRPRLVLQHAADVATATKAGRAFARALARRRAAADDESTRQAEADQCRRARHLEVENALRNRRAEMGRFASQNRAEADLLGRGHRVDAEQRVRLARGVSEQRWRARADHQPNRPGWWHQLRTFGGAGRKWGTTDRWLAGEETAARRDLAQAESALIDVQNEIDAAHRAADAADQEVANIDRQFADGVPVPVITHEPLVRAQREVTLADKALSRAQAAQAGAERQTEVSAAAVRQLDDQLERAASELGPQFPDATWQTDRQRRERAALWTDSAWNDARTRLFLAALGLHKAFLRHTATEMRRNLHAAMDVVSGEAPRDAPADAVLAAWQSLFLVVPVVSTTFASYGRVFGHLGRDALGWLLIDEAGQATPQNAVGALWRTKRAVVVGDPLQLEPITTLPYRAEQAIRNELGVDVQWSTSHQSVQRIADRLTHLGTALPGDDGPVWVGVPLTVHRRCDQPMFDVVNSIAYDGLMINETPARAAEEFAAKYPRLPDSKWIDVPALASQGHWVPAEGAQLDRILTTLSEMKFPMSEVLVIGPFRDVARQLRSRTRRHRGLVAGTVHTAQGKQADIVIVVLGSDPDRPGARRWASSKPNLLNVAVSRAKRRLYVIGDHDRWHTWPYFSTLAEDLPRAHPISS